MLIYGWAYIRNGESVSKLVGFYMGGLYSGGLYSEVYSSRKIPFKMGGFEQVDRPLRNISSLTLVEGWRIRKCFILKYLLCNFY